MATLIISFLLVVSLLLLVLQHIRSAKILILFSLALFFLTGTGVFSCLLLSQLELYSPLTLPVWKKNNVIILLGAGVIKNPRTTKIDPSLLAYPRLYETARLYFLCKKTPAKCTVLISGGDVLASGMSEAEVYQNKLSEIGVNTNNILLEKNSLNTYQNAQLTHSILQAKKFDDVFLVTSSIHMKRALLYFSQFQIIAIPCVTDFIPRKISFLPLGYYFALTDFALHEYIGIARLDFYRFMGWNSEVTKPGKA